MLYIRICRRRQLAFTITELAIVMLILGIMAGMITLNMNVARQTAKNEADRIMTHLYRLIETANRTHVSFSVLFDGTVQTESVPVEWQTPTTSQLHHTGYDRELKLSKGFSIQNLNYSLDDSDNMASIGRDSFNLEYNLGNNGFVPPGMTLQVTGNDESIYYIIVSAAGGRIRTSDTRPQ